MSKKLRIVMAQLNLTVGDIQGNLNKLIHAANTARDSLRADIIVYPELALTGYPPEDLLLRPAFIEKTVQALDIFKNKVKNIYALVGHPQLTSKGLFNACSLVYNQTIVARYTKQFLPNYGVFDEQRYFIAGDSSCVVSINDIPVGLLICEDLWHPQPIQQAANLGARLILCPNASPFEIDKHEQRHLILANRAKAANIPIVYVNCVGGQDELVFDGDSMLIDIDGSIRQQAGLFKEILFPVEIECSSTHTQLSSSDIQFPSTEEKIYSALVLAVQDYFRKNQFKGALVGASGGIDSALTLAIAVDALGKDHVKAVLMPSRYTSEASMQDALALIKNLNITSETISIEASFSSFLTSLNFSKNHTPTISEQNIQARCRNILLMALSNQTGKIVLSTSNRSETAVGYTTLYGDMSGGFAVLKDIPKTMVYQLAKYRNRMSRVIPEHTIERAPTAELAPNQTDQDSLPPYEVLDKIIELYINQAQSIASIIQQGFNPEIVRKVIRMINQNEYKRRQGPIGPRINHTAFGRDRRYPITSGFEESV